MPLNCHGYNPLQSAEKFRPQLAICHQVNEVRPCSDDVPIVEGFVAMGRRRGSRGGEDTAAKKPRPWAATRKQAVTL